MAPRFISALGLVTILAMAWLLSNNRRRMNWRVIGGGLTLQFAFAAFILKTELGQTIFLWARDMISGLVNLSDQGAVFVFGETFREHFFAFKVLPTIIFVSALSYLLFYWGLIQKVIAGLAWIMQATMNISGVEGLVTAANVFCGQTEAPLFVRPYLATMTRSEINTMMTGGMATVAGGVMAAYVGFGVSAGHLLAASLMSAPAAILISKIIHPETQISPTKGRVSLAFERKEVNAFEAACVGASEGLKLALNVGAMLITFVALVALANRGIAAIGQLWGVQASLEAGLGYAFRPMAYLMGVPWEESLLVGELLGERMVLNEFVAYVHLGKHVAAGALSERAIVISTYALCGFANFSSIAVQIGGIGALEPRRRPDFAACGLRAMLGGTLATFTSACIAGIMF